MDAQLLYALDRALCGSIWATNTAGRNLEALCLECGGRLAGSAGAARAVEMVSRLWQEYGLVDVHPEPFPCPVWQRGHALLTMTAPALRTYPCLALPYAPACDLTAEMLDLGYGLKEDFERAGEAARGKMVLVKNGSPPGARPVHRLEKYGWAKEAGAAAFIFSDGEPGMLAPTGSLLYTADTRPDQMIPGIGIAYEVAQELIRWAGRGPVTLHLQMENRTEMATSWNLVGEIPAAAPRGQDDGEGPLLMVGAHLDGHDIAQAAIDNGSGVIAVTEVARVLAAQSEYLPCRVRFICFGAEELGLWGAFAYARQHEAELDRVQFLFNLDCVGGHGPITLSLQNCPELATTFRQLIQELAAEVNVAEQLVPFSDHFPFTLQGVPCAFIASGGRDQRGWPHTAADTIDKVDLQSVRTAAAAVARLIVRLANGMVPWPGRRRSWDEVKAVLQAAGIEPLLRMQGIWPEPEPSPPPSTSHQ